MIKAAVLILSLLKYVITMKKLVIVTHPTIENSLVNKRWIEELKKYPAEFTVHALYEAYPDGKIDVLAEQKLVEAHDTVIFQYPLYWFFTPPLLKQWMDEVLVYGWAYGTGGDKMKGKKIGLAISAGIKEEDYQADGLYEVTIEQLSLPIKVTAQYIGATFAPIFTWYDVEHNPSPEIVEDSAKAYLAYAQGL